MSIHVQQPRPARAGFTLIEVVFVLGFMGLVLALVTPRIREATIRADVRSARGAVANLYARTRVAAIQTRKPATLSFNGNSAVITVPGVGKLDTIGGVMNLNQRYGVALAASTSKVGLQPTGLLTNPAVPIMVKVTKHGRSDSLRISGYGRMQ